MRAELQRQIGPYHDGAFQGYARWGWTVETKAQIVGCILETGFLASGKEWMGESKTGACLGSQAEASVVIQGWSPEAGL